MAFRLRRGTDAERQSVVFAEGELIYVTDTQEVYAGDGTTAGGNRITGAVSASPASLTRDLNLATHDITGTGNINIAGSITATQFVGDGSLLTNLPDTGGGGADIVEGDTYIINVQGDVVSDDSTVLVDANTGSFTGDGSNLTNITLNQLDDVGALSPNANDVLAYVGGNWTSIDIDSIYAPPGGDGIIEGQTYDINITGDVLADDSTVLVNTATQAISAPGGFTGNITGDVTGDITGNVTGDVTGNLIGDATGSLFADDSSLVVDGLTGNIHAQDIITSQNVSIKRPDNGVTQLYLYGNQNNTAIHLSSAEWDTDKSGDNINIGSVVWSINDTRGKTDVGYINMLESAAFYTHDPTGAFPQENWYTHKSNKFGFGDWAPTRVGVTIQNGSLVLKDTRTFSSITDMIDGEIAWDSTAKKLYIYDGDTDWREIQTTRTDILDGAGTYGSLFQLVPTAQADIDGLGNDSTGLAGGMLYNSDKDCFEFVQAGSYTNIPNSGDHTGQLSQWNQSTGKWEVSSWETPQTGQYLYWDGTHWSPTNAPAGGGGGGGSDFTHIGIAADDSAIRLINEGETISILGGTAITTTSDAEGVITIEGVAQDFTWGVITGTPTTLAGYSITDAATSAQGTLADSALQAGDAFDVQGSVFADDSTLLVDAVNGLITGPMENPTITGTIDSSDSSAITVVPAVVMNSDLTVENSLSVTNNITADTLTVTTLEYDNLVTTGAGTPEIESDGGIALTAGTRVEISSSPLKMASFTTAERDALSAEDGDMVYNTTTNKFQGYANGTWVDLN